MENVFVYIQNNIISVLAILLIAFNIAEGVRKGFMYKVFSIVSIFVAIFFTKIFSPIIIKKANELISTEIMETINSQNLFNAYDFGMSDIKITDYIIMFIVFIFFIIVFHFVAKLFKGLNKVPLIGGINKILGAFLGFLISILYLWIIFFIIRMLVSIPIIETINEMIYNTKWLRSIYDFNLIMYLLGLKIL
ncbi:MAG: CvpA family protein [Eubacteriales bacterium]|nr:CvpA family protein [Eubacteriales bacterium]